MGRAVGGNALMEPRIGAAEGLGDADGHALAGFLEAEGSFQIRPKQSRPHLEVRHERLGPR